MRAHEAGRRRAIARIVAVLALFAAVGCSAIRRDSLKLVDGQLQREPRLVRERVRGGFRLGPYTIVQHRLRQHGGDASAVTEGPPRPVSRWDLELELKDAAEPTPWRARCTGTRRSNLDSDFGVVAGIANDSVTIDCELAQAEARWRLSAAGRLDGNIAGELTSADPSASPAKVEIILWIKRVKLIPRHIAEPIAQVRRGDRAIAAMILSRPEWAWVLRKEAREPRAAAMTALAAIRLLPLGFDD